MLLYFEYTYDSLTDKTLIMGKDRRIAKLENDLVMKAHYSLSAIEQKIMLHLVSQLDPKNRNSFEELTIPIKNMEYIVNLEGARWGSMYDYLRSIRKKLSQKQIEFTSPITINGNKIIEGELNWFQHIYLIDDEKEGISLKFLFSDDMKPFLLQLNQYVRINTIEVMDMRGKHSIRLYQVFKAERERTKVFKKVSIIVYDIEELKSMLGIARKYPLLANFRRRVLEPVKNEINACSNEISISYEYLKTRRKVTGIEFSIYDKKTVEVIPTAAPKNNLENYVPSKKDLAKLTFAQSRAYEALLAFGVYRGIAYRQILPTVKGAEMEGYEDIFVEQAIKLFKKKEKGKKDSKDKSAGAFVNWWTKKKVFDISGDVFFQISDQVHAAKKKLDPERVDNRVVAKGMTRGEFEKWYKGNKPGKKKL